ncbi:hypothetical protein BUALT_Bualt19G0100700 [Buddleja alternifolia]|uniref:Pre-mRNA-processing protein 40A n=1 Tax=Buddleja alternifolia TaxID=168488 RepID=A0AAV6WB51_9LAMI|nr:hypothetical protein BUALT_Bualt19G0100700 [Buddleja alternifolia]
MENPSIEAVIKLEKIRANRKLKEPAQRIDNPIVERNDCVRVFVDCELQEKTRVVQIANGVTTARYGVKPLRPRIVAHVPPPPSPLPPMYQQFRPVIPPPVPPPFVPMDPQQFQPVGLSMPPHPPQIQHPQAAPPQPPPPQRPTLAVPPLQPPAQPQIPNNFMPGFGGPRMSHTPYNLPPLSQQQMYVGSTPQQPWFSIPNQNMQPALPIPQAVEQSAGLQPWFSTVNQNVQPLQQNGEQNAGVQQSFPNENQNVQLSQKTEEQSVSVVKNTIPDRTAKVLPDWKEYSRDGKKYYYNKRTKISSWEKPVELMTPNERADATTDWREFITPEGRRYYFNKITKKSKWQIPDEVKLARERINTSLCEETPTIKDVNSYPPPPAASVSVSVPVPVPGVEESNPNTNNSSSSDEKMVSSPVAVTPGVNPDPVVSSGSSDEVANLKSDATGLVTPLEAATSAVDSETPVPTATTSLTTPMEISNESPKEVVPSPVETSGGGVEEANKNIESSANEGINTTEVKKLEPLVYESKEEAKNAFKALLESANVGSDWNWDQAMRVIINDRRYGALRTLGERKQTFNEFVGQMKKQEAEEKRARNKKVREDFKKMLEESKDLTSSTRWSKAISMFEKDERFQAVERVKDREDLFDDHLEDLKKRERAKALEEQKRHQTEYLEFLKSCDFIKASSQWRKVQHRLEADERCTRVDKIKRLEIFQEEQRKAERKNRDEFRKLMEEHVASGILTANSHWREYCTKVKDAPAYLAVSSNTSGSTAKELFSDVIEDLEKQYSEDKEKIEDAIKDGKISLSTSWTLEDFKGALPKEISAKPISDTNLKLVFNELLEITKEKEEKEAKKRKRLAEDVYDFLFNSKEITSSSKWEDCKPLVEERFVGEENFFVEIFDKVILELKEKAKEKERRRKDEKAKKEKERKDRERKDKERKNKERGLENRKGRDRHRTDETDHSDGSDSYSLEESRRSRDRNKRHHRHSSDSKRSKQVEKMEGESESQSKRHKRDRRDPEEHKEGDFGEDGEVR